MLARLPLYDAPVALGLDFTYTPLAAVLFIPMAMLPLTATHAVVTMLNLAALGFAVCLSRNALDRSLPAAQVFSRSATPGRSELAGLTVLLAGLLFWIEPVRTTVYLGQINLLLMVIVLWDLLRGNDRRSKGIGVGIAAGIKLTPLIFVDLEFAAAIGFVDVLVSAAGGGDGPAVFGPRGRL